MTVTIAKSGPLAVPLDDLKAYLKISLTDEDDALTDLLRTASEAAERFLGQLVVARSVDEVLPAGSGWRTLAIRPVRSITAVTGIPAEGAEFALPVENYAIDIDAGGVGRPCCACAAHRTGPNRSAVRRRVPSLAPRSRSCPKGRPGGSTADPTSISCSTMPLMRWCRRPMRC